MRRSTGRFYAFCAVVFALGLSASAYLNFIQYQRMQDRAQLDQENIAQLKREVNLNQSAASPTASLAPALGVKTVKITEFGVMLTAVTPLNDLTYQFQQQDGLEGVNLSSASLINSTTTCGPGSLGRIVRQATTAHTTLPSTSLVKQLGDYNYYYQPAKTACAKDPVTTAALKADNAIMPAILTTLVTTS